MSYTFIFIGRSGAGKGTQAPLLEESLKKIDSTTEIVRMETGNIFRSFIKGDKWAQQKAKSITDAGGLQPEFLTINLWSTFFIEHFRNDPHIIIDGTPRKPFEATVLHGAFEFFERKKPIVVYLNVTRDWATEKLMARKRNDDTAEGIAKRLAWFDTEVLPTIEYYRHNPAYQFIEINGERPVSEVHEELLVRSGLKK
jgi:adenylate kinase family enzyme